MQWIKYQILQNVTDEEEILIEKRVGYNEANLAIAQAEAYNGEYEVIEDWKPTPGKPLDIIFGGTGARSAEDALTNLGVLDYITEQGKEAVEGTTSSGKATYYWYYRKWNSGKVEAWLPYYYNNFEAAANEATTFNIPVPQGIFSKAPNFITPSIRTGSESSNLGLCTLTTSVEGISPTNISVQARNAHTAPFKPHVCIYAVQF